MKHRINLVSSLVVLFFLFYSASPSVSSADGGLVMQDYENFDEMLNDMIWTEGGTDNSYIDELKFTLSRVKPKILEEMALYNWSFCITGYDIAQYYFDGQYGNKVRGFTDIYSRTIYVEPRALYNTPIHEIGHFLDWFYGFPSINSKFSPIYDEEVEEFKSNIDNPGCVSNATEFFAETFYWMHEDVSRCTPKAYEFVEKYYDNYY